MSTDKATPATEQSVFSTAGLGLVERLRRWLGKPVNQAPIAGHVPPAPMPAPAPWKPNRQLPEAPRPMPPTGIRYVTVAFLDGQVRTVSELTFSRCLVAAAQLRMREGACTHRELTVDMEATRKLGAGPNARLSGDQQP